MNKVGLSELGTALQQKQHSAYELTAFFLDRIEKAKHLHTFLNVNDEAALQRAKEIDAMRIAGEKLHPLAGIPFSVKDNLCTLGVKTTCGSKMLADFIPPYDAHAVKCLKDAGMILLGKNNMDEFGMGSTGENTAFTAAAFCHTDGKLYVPGGSSSGGAAAVKEGLTPIALGSDTGGSVRTPAAFCGIFGLKPTYGSISRSGLVSFAPSMDTVGILGNSPADIKLLYDVLAGKDAADATSVELPKADVSYPTQLKAALPEEYLYADGVSKRVREAILRQAEQMERCGYRVEPISMPMTKSALAAYYVIACAEAAANLARFDGVRYGHRTEEYRDVNDLIARSRSEGFGAEVKRRILMGNYVLSAGHYDAYYKKAAAVKQKIKAEFDAVLSRYDMILTPTAPTVSMPLGSKKWQAAEMYASDLCTVPASLAGLPAISVPLLEADALPVGMQFIGRPFSEDMLIKQADRICQTGR